MNHSGKEIYEVFRPVGEAASKTLRPAPRLDTLNGKTVCEVWNASYRGEITFPKIRELLRKKYPDVHIVPYSEFPLARHYDIDEILKELPQLLRQKGCDALISGNSG